MLKREGLGGRYATPKPKRILNFLRIHTDNLVFDRSVQYAKSAYCKSDQNWRGVEGERKQNLRMRAPRGVL